MNRIKDLRELTGKSMRQISIELEIPYTTYVSYEKGDREPNSEMLIKLADFFDCSVDYLIGKSEDKDVPKSSTLTELMEKYDNIRPIQLKKFPMLGEIACGEPIFADEDRESFVMADEEIQADFCLKAKGDSMINARINDGDVVFIKECPMVENGEIAAVIIDNDATLKRVYYYPRSNKLVLNPENPAYEPLVYIGEELNTIRILGRAVCFMSEI